MDSLRKLSKDSVHCLIDEKTQEIKVQGSSGRTLVSFSAESGVKIHPALLNQAEEKKGVDSFLQCSYEKPGWPSWKRFIFAVEDNWGIHIPLGLFDGKTPGLEAHKKAMATWINEGAGGKNFVLSPDGSLTCLVPFIFTWAIISDVTEGGYTRRWCFKEYAEAEGALRDWLQNEAPEPVGYVRKTHA